MTFLQSNLCSSASSSGPHCDCGQLARMEGDELTRAGPGPGRAALGGSRLRGWRGWPRGCPGPTLGCRRSGRRCRTFYGAANAGANAVPEAGHRRRHRGGERGGAGGSSRCTPGRSAGASRNGTRMGARFKPDERASHIADGGGPGAHQSPGRRAGVAGENAARHKGNQPESKGVEDADQPQQQRVGQAGEKAGQETLVHYLIDAVELNGGDEGGKDAVEERPRVPDQQVERVTARQLIESDCREQRQHERSQNVEDAAVENIEKGKDYGHQRIYKVG